MSFRQVSDVLHLARHRERRRGSKDIAVLAAPFTVEWDRVQVTVTEGFSTDLASIPRVVPGWIASRLDGIEAAVVHDYLYVHHEQTREFADRLFREMLRHDPDVPAWRREIMYRAVRLFGGSVY